MSTDPKCPEPLISLLHSKVYNKRYKTGYYFAARL